MYSYPLENPLAITTGVTPYFPINDLYTQQD